MAFPVAGSWQDVVCVFANSAEEYLTGGACLCGNHPYGDRVILHLFAHAIELGLKSVVLHEKQDTKWLSELRKGEFGHNLDRLLTESSLDLERIGERATQCIRQERAKPFSKEFSEIDEELEPTPKIDAGLIIDHLGHFHSSSTDFWLRYPQTGFASLPNSNAVFAISTAIVEEALRRKAQILLSD